MYMFSSLFNQHLLMWMLYLRAGVPVHGEEDLSVVAGADLPHHLVLRADLHQGELQLADLVDGARTLRRHGCKEVSPTLKNRIEGSRGKTT